MRKLKIISVLLLAKLLCLFFFEGDRAFAQSQDLTFVFQLNYDGQHLLYGKENTFVQGQDTVQIKRLRYYVSGFRFFKEGTEVYAEKDSYHLIDLNVLGSNELKFTQVPIGVDSLHFLIGIDSLTNVSGAMGGDLDPTKGMYWTWNSGYINFKLEGIHTRSVARNKEFALHLGGYKKPYQTARGLGFRLSNKKQYAILLNVQPLLHTMNMQEKPHVMSPGELSAQFASLLSKLFSLD